MHFIIRYVMEKIKILKKHLTDYPLPIKIHNKIIRKTSWFDAPEAPTSNISDTAQTILRCKKVDIILSPTQKEIVDTWFDIYKSTYNQAVKFLRNNPTKSKTNFIRLRASVKSEFTSAFIKRMEDSCIHVHTVDNAIHDVAKAYDSAFGLAKITKKRFRIRYKRDNSQDTILLEASCFSRNKNSFSSKVGIVESSLPIMGIKHGCRLQKNKDKYTLFVPEKTPTKTNITKKKLISLDPGLRTYQTGYILNEDKTTEVVEYGSNFVDKIKPILDRILPDSPKIRRFNQRLYDKAKHCINDLQWKLAKELASGYNTVVIGNMSTKGVLSGRKLNGKTKSLLNMASHYRFRQRLKEKCEEYGTKFVEQDESYTSKTCGKCGLINENLGASKTFICQCGFNTDRDVNGARNILIKSKIK